MITAVDSPLQFRGQLCHSRQGKCRDPISPPGTLFSIGIRSPYPRSRHARVNFGGRSFDPVRRGEFYRHLGSLPFLPPAQQIARTVPNILDRIVEKKRLEIAENQAKCSLQDMQQQAASAVPPREFLGELRASQSIALIAEVKKASPSQGVIREDFDPCSLASAYQSAGATCISVLTDEHFFQGHLDYLSAIREVVDLPLLRKDFILSPYQVYEARAAGADAVLLIAECLTAEELAELNALAIKLGMVALIELYDAENLPGVLASGTELVGVNNRDLRTFEVDLQHTVRMREQIPDNVVLVGESGIHSRDDALMLEAHQIDAMLVGESLMRQPDVAQATRDLLGN